MSTLTALTTGLSAATTGAMALIARTVTHRWTDLPDRDFQTQAVADLSTWGPVMVPAIAGTSLALAATNLTTHGATRRWAIAALAAHAGIIATTIRVAVPINTRLAAPERVATDQLKQDRDRWIRGHLVRTALGIATTAALIAASRSPDPIATTNTHPG